MSDTRKPSEVLQAALESFGPEGQFWCQGTGATGGCRCAAVAVMRASEGLLSEERNLIISIYLDALVISGPLVKGGLRPIAQYNDARGRTFEDMRHVFLKGIELAKQQEASL